jgi:hypothetical protein
MRRVPGRRWPRALGLAVFAVALFGVAFVLVGVFAAGFSTAPPPGLGCPYPTFWGLGWHDVGGLFVKWNLLGLAFLLAALFLCSGVRRSFGRLGRMALCAAPFYVAALTPYLWTGALVHGWGGGYVLGECERRLTALNAAVLDYAKDHGDRLPDVEDLDALFAAVGDYLDEDAVRFAGPPDVCPLGRAYDRRPERYVWDRAAAGMKIRDAVARALEEHQFPVSCPYHGERFMVGTELYQRLIGIRYGRGAGRRARRDTEGAP